MSAIRQPTEESSDSPLTLGRLAVILRRRWLVVVACVILAVAAALSYTVLAPPTYQSTAVVTLPPAVNPPSTGGNPATQTSTLNSLPSPTAELASPAVTHAARAISPAAGPSTVTSGFDPTNNQLAITATGHTATDAQAAATAYAKAFVNHRQGDLQAQSSALQSQISELAGTIASLEAQCPPGPTATTSPATNPCTSKLAVAVSESQSLYAQNLDIQLAGPPVITTQAPLPSGPSGGIGKAGTLGLGALAGLLVGLGLALLRDQFDDRLHGSSELSEIGDLPILAELPEDRAAAAEGAVAAADSPHSVLAEAMRGLRTNLQFLAAHRSLRHVAVASPTPNDGKSFVSANLAAVWAQTGKEVVLVSSDLRRPQIEAMLGVSSSNDGLSSVLAPGSSNGTKPQRSAPQPGRNRLGTDLPLRKTRVPNLHLLPCGPAAPNPAELLASDALPGVLEELTRVSDLVVLDTPPVLAVTDAAIVGKVVDAVVLVLAEGKTERGAARRALRQLSAAGVTVAGVVLNRCPQAETTRYYPYEYTADPGRRHGWSRILSR